VQDDFPNPSTHRRWGRGSQRAAHKKAASKGGFVWLGVDQPLS
jgi:hypothetical protein